MTYTDGKYLMADSLEELHKVAQAIGIPKKSFFPKKKHPHYLITTNFAYHRALKQGVKRVSTRDLILLGRKKLIKFTKS